MNIENKLKTARLFGLPFSWGTDGAVVYGEAITTAQKAAIAAIVGEAVDEWPKEQAWERIKVERDRRRFDGGVKVGTHWFLSTQQATSEYMAVILLGSALPAGTVLRAAWRTMTAGVTVDMTAALAAQILGSGFQSIAAIDDAAQRHRGAMEASADPAAYDFSGGWPAVFAD